MDKWVDHVAAQESPGAMAARTEEQWEKYKHKRDLDTLVSDSEGKYKLETFKKNYLKYGSIYGKN